MAAPITDPVRRSADALARATGVDRHPLAVVMGSGWAPAADAIGEPVAEVELAALSGFSKPMAIGHRGIARSVPVDDQRVLVLMGRTHLYEGLGIAAVLHGVRTAVAAGAETVILTNAAGGLRSDMWVGQPVLIADQLNLTARGLPGTPPLPDRSSIYSSRLRELACTIEPTLADGVYAQLPGPHFETPAEIRMLRTLGADLVGMSTAVEAIAARAAGAEVLGVSLVSNLAAGMTGDPLDADEVIRAGRAAAGSIGSLLAAVIAAIIAQEHC